MGKQALRKEKWTLSFDAQLKKLIVRTAKRKGIYPVHLLEAIVRERFNPYGYTDVQESVAYLQSLRKASRDKTDETFLKEIREWQKLGSL